MIATSSLVMVLDNECTMKFFMIFLTCLFVRRCREKQKIAKHEEKNEPVSHVLVVLGVSRLLLLKDGLLLGG